jgi:outer membrane protein OmpA-like peptidoglycan-associated protein
MLKVAEILGGEKHMRHFWVGAGLIAGSVVFSSGAWAQANPSSAQIVDLLSGPKRGIRMPSSSTSSTDSSKPAVQTTASAQPMPSHAVPAAPAPSAESEAPSVNLTVQFRSGSADLTPQAIDVLNRLGQALTDPKLAGSKFKIEGHTDTVGTAELNKDLSERRAEAVASYLSSKFGIDGSHLQPVGMGSSELLVPTPDQVAEPRNRRVQIINLGA